MIIDHSRPCHKERKKQEQKTVSIAVIASSIPSRWANSINTMKHADAFSKLGHKVKIYSIINDMQEDLRNELHDAIYDWYGISPIPINYHKTFPFFFHTNFLPYKGIRWLDRKIFRNAFQAKLNPHKRIAEECFKAGVDFAYCRGFFPMIACMQKGIPCVIETHGAIISEPMKKAFAYSNHDAFRGVITISESLKSKYIAEGVLAEKILVKHDAVNLSLFDGVSNDKKTLRSELGLPLGFKLIMYVGSLKPGKAIHKIVEAANADSNSFHRYVLVGGTENDFKQYRNLCTERGMQKLIFVSFQNNQLVPRYMKAADILLLPYDIEETQSVMDMKTTSPIKLFEYMASQRPIVAHLLPNFASVLTESDAWTVPLGHKILPLIEKVLSLSDQERKKKCDQAYQKVQNYTYLKRARCILDLAQIDKRPDEQI
ncbi:Uncharacterized protein SCG7109_AR_00080 [Chlamydiales bacterium SCGC AG-110-M15]|nr:Uncharacterized protein SCG7109_AR_00080 [Chlamydiales bacterium SCGC AG-110-M15]